MSHGFMSRPAMHVTFWIMLVSCRPGVPGPEEPRIMPNDFEVELLATPQTLSMSERPAFRVGIQVINRGAQTRDPEIYDTVLLVNGARSVAWDLAVQSGVREDEWYALPPGQMVRAEWPLGEALFPEPGEYSLLLRFQDQEAGRRTISVRPSP